MKYLRAFIIALVSPIRSPEIEEHRFLPGCQTVPKKTLLTRDSPDKSGQQELETFAFIRLEEKLMKTWKLHVILAMLLLPICSATAPAQTQAAINKTACDQYTKADGELNGIYQSVLREHKDNALFLRKMR
ncbi:MAG: hypothetical protein ND866_26190, partial [Pyrinomonadaceae bacterium]|nr:hypothetical protein [Pyrinomonadaceae bacterium]